MIIYDINFLKTHFPEMFIEDFYTKSDNQKLFITTLLTYINQRRDKNDNIIRHKTIKEITKTFFFLKKYTPKYNPISLLTEAINKGWTYFYPHRHHLQNNKLSHRRCVNIMSLFRISNDDQYLPDVITENVALPGEYGLCRIKETIAAIMLDGGLMYQEDNSIDILIDKIRQFCKDTKRDYLPLYIIHSCLQEFLNTHNIKTRMELAQRMNFNKYLTEDDINFIFTFFYRCVSTVKVIYRYFYSTKDVQIKKKILVWLYISLQDKISIEQFANIDYFYKIDAYTENDTKYIDFVLIKQQIANPNIKQIIADIIQPFLLSKHIVSSIKSYG